MRHNLLRLQRRESLCREMMKVSVCIGSACHLKGSHDIVSLLNRKIEENGLEDAVQLAGVFCLGNCVNAVSVKIGDDVYSVTPETASEFFDEQIMARLS